MCKQTDKQKEREARKWRNAPVEIRNKREIERALRMPRGWLDEIEKGGKRR